MKVVGKVRKELGIRTLFNLLGPLVNPAGARRQIVGVFSLALTEKLAEALRSWTASMRWYFQVKMAWTKSVLKDGPRLPSCAAGRSRRNL